MVDTSVLLGLYFLIASTSWLMPDLTKVKSDNWLVLRHVRLRGEGTCLRDVARAQRDQKSGPGPDRFFSPSPNDEYACSTKFSRHD